MDALLIKWNEKAQMQWCMMMKLESNRKKCSTKPGALLQVNLLLIMTSREQRLITKECIGTHTNLILWFNPLNTQVL